jgi:streptomycin 6-kinase
VSGTAEDEAGPDLSGEGERSAPARWARRELCAERLSAICEGWRLRVTGTAEGGYASNVFWCEDDAGTPLVLKVGHPLYHPEREAAALELWAGAGAARLLRFDAASGAMLLERLVPGTPLSGVVGARHIANLLRELHRTRAPGPPIPDHTDALEERLQLMADQTEAGTEGARLFLAAREKGRELARNAVVRVLLHGDFLDKNILRSADSWAAIDPMPAIGDPCSDVGHFAAARPPASDIFERAAKLASELGHDTGRARSWAAFWAVGEGCETWRHDSNELQALLRGPEVRELLGC